MRFQRVAGRFYCKALSPRLAPPYYAALPPVGIRKDRAYEPAGYAGYCVPRKTTFSKDGKGVSTICYRTGLGF